MDGPARTPRIGSAHRRALSAALLAAVAFVLAAPSAQARDFNCDASAIRLQLGTAAAVEPVIANRGEELCKEVKLQTAAVSGAVSGGVLLAETVVPGAADAQANGGVGSLVVGSGALAGLAIPTLDAVDALPAVDVPIPLAGTLLGLPSSISVDIRPAVEALVTGANSAPLLEVAGSIANARATCVNSKPQLSGSSQVSGLSVLGQQLPVDAVLDQAVKLYDGQTIDPTTLDLSKIVLPAGLSITDPLTGAILQGALESTLATLAPITLPESLLDVSFSPSSQQTADGGLTQRGLQIALSVVNQNVVTAVVGEARVSNDSVNCARGASTPGSIETPRGIVAPPESVTEEALSCSSRRLALIDVIDKGDYVRLFGAADKRLAGKRIKIRSRADGEIVARPRVSETGLFHARAPLPPERLRDSNRARYVAIRGKNRSLNLKLHRRMVFTAVRSRHGKVILRGLVSKPHTKPRSVVVIRQRLTCHRQKTVARVRPNRKGRFRVVLKAPRDGDVGVYRATTMVAYPHGGPDFRTYTLPGLVRFAR